MASCEQALDPHLAVRCDITDRREQHVGCEILCALALRGASILKVPEAWKGGGSAGIVRHLAQLQYEVLERGALSLAHACTFDRVHVLRREPRHQHRLVYMRAATQSSSIGRAIGLRFGSCANAVFMLQLFMWVDLRVSISSDIRKSRVDTNAARTEY